MLRASNIRIAVALATSIAVHGLLLGLDPGMRKNHPLRSPARKVTFNLVPRQPEPSSAVARQSPPKAGPEVVRKVTPPAWKKEQKKVPEPVREKKPQPVPVPEKARVKDPLPGGRQIEDHEPEPQRRPEAGQEKGHGQPAASGNPGMVKVVMARPLYRINPPPPYPAKARRRNLQGTVILEVDVSAAGKVDRLRINESCGHRVLDRAAMAAVREWVFEPGSRNGVHIGMTVLVPVRFALQ